MSTNIQTVYIGGAISHLSVDEAYTRLNDIKTTLINTKGYKDVTHSLEDVYLHLAADEVVKPKGYTDSFWTSDISVVNRCLTRIKSCDTVIFNFLGVDKVSIGSVYELAVAREYDKYIIVLMEDDNIHQHCFITQHACEIHGSLQELYDNI
jgi:nucleoside 2-deoxyribosyltransferase